MLSRMKERIKRTCQWLGEEWRWLILAGTIGVLLVITLTGLAVVFRKSLGIDRESAAIIQAGVLVALAIITALYAAHTHDVARRTAEQVKASHLLARQTEKQLHHSFRPILEFKTPATLPTFTIVTKNIGVGPATNVRCWVALRFPNGKTNRYNTDNSGRIFHCQVLPPGDSAGDGGATWEATVAPEISDVDSMSFFAVYQDIYDNFFVSENQYVKVGDELKAGEFSVRELDAERAQKLFKEGGFGS